MIADDLKFGTVKHDAIRTALIARRNFSRDKMRERHQKWIDNEEAYVAYMPEKEADAKRRGLREAGEPQFTTIKIPFDYAVLMAAHTYWTSVFFNRSPVLQYAGRNAAGEDKTLAVEALMDYQVQVGRQLPPLYIWLMDAGKYGLGILGTYWDKEKIVVGQETEVADMFLGVNLGTSTKQLQRSIVEGFQGNKAYNVCPYDFFPDPRVSIQQFQEGEFCGRYTAIGWNRIAKGSAAGKYFNIEYLRNQRTGEAGNRDYGSPHIVRPYEAGTGMQYSDVLNMRDVDILEMYVELIPKEWGLGDSTYPEKWVFVLAADQVLIAAQPLGCYCDKYPFYCLEYEPDGAAMFKRSLLEIIGPMTDVITWLINTHFYNTRKSLNDMFVVDPTKIVLKDLKDPSPGKIIRLKEEMYGQDVRSAIWQFPVTDVTQQHIADTQIMNQMIQRVSGVNDQVMGLLNTGGRKTAAEVRTSSSFGVNRLKTICEWFSITGFSDYAQTTLQLTQQYYDTTMKLRLAGDAFLHPGAIKELTITPNEIQGFFDVVPVDGTLPVDRFAQVNMWGTLLQQFATMPEVVQQYDFGRIFAWVAQLGGLKNIHRFKVQIVEPEMMTRQAQQGNVIPMRGQQSGQGNYAGGSPRGEGEPPTPAQIPAMGPSG